MTHSSIMVGKRGLIMGVANNHSIAWGIAKALHDHGAELAFTFQGEVLQKRVEPLAASVGSSFLIPCDVSQEGDIRKTFQHIQKQVGEP
jgi:Enoyl-[acyl-carrier-protein] reductase (NADH)